MKCPEKRRYTTYERAVAAALVRLESKDDLPALAVYRCPLCAGFHLTKQEQRTPRWPAMERARA